jgi:hypothetical protein
VASFRTARLNASGSSLQPRSRAVRMNFSVWLSAPIRFDMCPHQKASSTIPSWRRRPSGGFRLAVCQPFTLYPGQNLSGALAVIHAKSGSVVISEVELDEIPMQVPFATMLVDTTHPALEEREEAFQCVGVSGAASPLSWLWLTDSCPAKCRPMRG